jgi:hypothetical protein
MEAAWDLANPRITNKGENISPPPRPTMVRTKEIKKIVPTSKRERCIMPCPYPFLNPTPL